MKNQLFAALVNILLGMLTPDLIRQFMDMVLDFVEDFVVGSKSKVDDKLVLPLCAQIRLAFDIPDTDDNQQ